ncbi:MAG: chemotaxis protein CheB [Dysosmobacter sp.]
MSASPTARRAGTLSSAPWPKKIVVASCAKVRPSAAMSRPGFRPSAPSALGRSGGVDLTQTIIGLGASTGGTEATLEVLKRLPADIPGMVIVQHMPPGFTKDVRPAAG